MIKRIGNSRRLREEDMPKGRELELDIKAIIKDNGFNISDLNQFIDFCYSVAEDESELVYITSNATSERYRLLYRTDGTFVFSLRDVSVMDYPKSVKFRQDVHGLSKILEELQNLNV